MGLSGAPPTPAGPVQSDVSLQDPSVSHWAFPLGGVGRVTSYEVSEKARPAVWGGIGEGVLSSLWESEALWSWLKSQVQQYVYLEPWYSTGSPSTK